MKKQVAREVLLWQKPGEKAAATEQSEHVFILLLADFGNTTVQPDMGWWGVTNVATHTSRKTPAKLTGSLIWPPYRHGSSYGGTHACSSCLATQPLVLCNYCAASLLLTGWHSRLGICLSTADKNFSPRVQILKAAFSHSSPESTTSIGEARARNGHNPWLNPTKLAEAAELAGQISTWSVQYCRIQIRRTLFSSKEKHFP